LGGRFAKLRVPIFFGPGRDGPGNKPVLDGQRSGRHRLEFSAVPECVEIDKGTGGWPHDEYTLNSRGPRVDARLRRARAIGRVAG